MSPPIDLAQFVYVAKSTGTLYLTIAGGEPFAFPVKKGEEVCIVTRSLPGDVSPQSFDFSWVET